VTKRDHPSRPEDPLDLGERLLGMGHVEENRLRVDHVEALVGEGQVEDATLAEGDVRHADLARACAGAVELLRADVDADGLAVGPPGGETDRDRARPAAAVEDAARRTDLIAEEYARALRGPEPHVRERAFLVADGVRALGRHLVLPLHAASANSSIMIGAA